MNALTKQMQRDIVLIDELLSDNSENGCVEFKHNNESPDMIGKLCSALSNVARIEEKDYSYVIWGNRKRNAKYSWNYIQPRN